MKSTPVVPSSLHLLHSSPMGIGQRIQEVLDEIEKKQVWLCERAGVDTGTLSAIIKRDSVRSVFAPQIADALEVNERWLTTGQGPKFKSARHMASEQIAHFDNLTPHSVRRPVPVISLIQAGEMADAHTPFEPGEGIRFESPRYKLGPHGWANEVDGWSMYDGTDNGIQPGWIIFCDPDVAPFPNALVIAKHVGMQKATFKQLAFEDDGWLLRPLNKDPIYKSIVIDDPKLRVIAVVTEAQPRSIKFV